MIREVWDRINHFHIPVSRRFNEAVSSLMTCMLILYSLVGIIQFSTYPAINPVPFITAYVLWIILGCVVLIKYRHKPVIAIGLYFIVIAVDRLISFFITFDIEEYEMLDYLDMVMSFYMLISGILWAFGKVKVKIFCIIATSILLALDIPLLYDCMQEFDILDDVFLFALTEVLRGLFYMLVIAILLINDIVGEDTKVLDANL